MLNVVEGPMRMSENWRGDLKGKQQDTKRTSAVRDVTSETALNVTHYISKCLDLTFSWQ
jgi:hypothetical protein